MKVWNVYDDEIREIAHEVGLGIWGDRTYRIVWDPDGQSWTVERDLPPQGGIRRRGRAYSFRLKVGPKVDGVRPFQKLGYNGRKTAFVCWHGHRAFLMRLFGRFPDARVDSSIAYYHDRNHFLRTYIATQGRNNDFNVNMDADCVCDVPSARRRRERRPARPPQVPDYSVYTAAPTSYTAAATSAVEGLTAAFRDVNLRIRATVDDSRDPPTWAWAAPGDESAEVITPEDPRYERFMQALYRPPEDRRYERFMQELYRPYEDGPEDVIEPAPEEPEFDPF